MRHRHTMKDSSAPFGARIDQPGTRLLVNDAAIVHDHAASTQSATQVAITS
jgi:hypothetical protein